jgi:hypothetical protein
MTDQENLARFIMMRSQGWSFNRITVELGVSKPTLIKWSRQHQFEIQNLRVTETEALAEKLFKPLHQRWEAMARDLARVEEELAKRNLDTVPTARLFGLVTSLRGKIGREIGETKFSETNTNIPQDEYVIGTHNWSV